MDGTSAPFMDRKGGNLFKGSWWILMNFDEFWWILMNLDGSCQRMSGFRKHAFFGRVCDGIGFAFSLRELQTATAGVATCCDLTSRMDPPGNLDADQGLYSKTVRSGCRLIYSYGMDHRGMIWWWVLRFNLEPFSHVGTHVEAHRNWTMHGLVPISLQISRDPKSMVVPRSTL